MKVTKFILTTVFCFGTWIISKAQTLEAPFQPNWESLSQYKCPEWYKNAQFGIFIHWGVYSVPAFGSEWYPRHMYDDTTQWGDNYYQYHVQKSGTPDQFGMVNLGKPSYRKQKVAVNNGRNS
jgi:hypothetical protein